MPQAADPQTRVEGRGERPQGGDLDRSERATAELASRLGRLIREVVAAATDKPAAREQVTRLVLEAVLAMFAGHAERIPLRPPASSRDDPRLILSPAQVRVLEDAARDFQWKDVRPEILGSIFEQALDPDQRHELGAHFTREADIARVVGPSVVAPWREQIAAIRTPAAAAQAIARMQAFHVLDPACGCGNFLAVVYREMKRLEAALADRWTELHADIAPPPGPWFTIQQLHGIEIDGLAAAVARVVLAIAEQLASRELGLEAPARPRDDGDSTIRHADALIVDWPRPEGELAIVGNPPFLGVRKLRREFGDERVLQLFARYPGNRGADYATYWFTRALELLRPGERAGYVCTNSIAQNEGRAASIDRLLAAGGTITDAWRSYPWAGEAAVHIAIVNWVMSPWPGPRTLEGRVVPAISPGLTEAVGLTTARPLRGNAGLCFMGVTSGNEGFVLTNEQRAELLRADPRSASVIRPLLIGRDVSRDPEQRPTRHIIDFAAMGEPEAQTYAGAYRHLLRHVYAKKHSGAERKTDAEKLRWWQFVRPRPQMRAAIAALRCVLVIPCLAPHLVVSRQARTTCFDHQLMVVALPEYYHFGILQSHIHAIWARARGSTLKGDLRYTNTTIFETFPFPPLSATRYLPGARPAGSKADRVAETAETFDRMRSAACKQQGLGLTRLHHQLHGTDGSPSPLRSAHDALSDAVTDCYGFPAGVWRDELETLRLLLQLNHRLAELP